MVTGVKNFQKFIDYNIKDVELVDRMEDKLGLITLAVTMAYRGGVNYMDTFGTTAIWDSIIYRDLYENKIAIPFAEDKINQLPSLISTCVMSEYLFKIPCSSLGL